MMDRQGRGLAETVWTRLDRKAGAITELTIRQLRHRLSTWVVLAVGFLLLIALLALFIGGIRDGWEPIDNDGDSHDWDGDGYIGGYDEDGNLSPGNDCLLYTSPSPRDGLLSRMPSSA